MAASIGSSGGKRLTYQASKQRNIMYKQHRNAMAKISGSIGGMYQRSRRRVRRM